jgi:hypothetical protein
VQNNPIPPRLVSILAFLVLGSLSFGCTTSKTSGLEDYDENNKAHGAAFLVDAMHIRRPMPDRGDWTPLQFYYKHCTELGQGSYYSKTSYTCSDPY